MSGREVILGDGQVRLLQGDCRDILPTLGKVDAVVTDPPYGTTQCAWDTVIPFSDIWGAMDKVAGGNVPVILFGAEPFSSFLRASKIDWFRYDWIWHKKKATGFLNAKKQPMRAHEIISVFCHSSPPYFPKMTTGHERKVSFRGKHLQTDVYGDTNNDYLYDSTERYPRSVITISSDTQNSSYHPTQKPVELCAYIVETYTSCGGVVCDFAMGSGTTGVACVQLGRKFIGIEKEQKYFDIAVKRISDELARPRLPLDDPKPKPVQEALL